MARLTAISGLGGKLPAAFLLEAHGKRLLLDLGEGPEPGIFPDLSQIGTVDAICLSHSHLDHTGALHLASEIGNPPIYATAMTFLGIGLDVATERRCRVIPDFGHAEIEGVPVILGRCGHAPGGVWFHFPVDGGILYTGDWSVESLLLPFDTPPRAALMVTDASYGDRDISLSDQISVIIRAARTGCVLPVPSGGRGPEMALALFAAGLETRVCPQVRREIETLIARPGLIADASKERLAAYLRSQSDGVQAWHPSDIIIAAEANGEAGVSAQLVGRIDDGFRFIFSSHVPHGTPAARLIAQKRAEWLPWNVHPRRHDVLHLADVTNARDVIPVFVKPDDMPFLAEKLGNRLRLEKTTELLPAEA
ncbi:MBL fold metallo-hydrolase [Aureimonas fodinaquatilis]|uniref:MBL fold metallo-hydrolase n=1 Tax=Aureimonas fodinaquatilis TaxID=2565783 RepID=A0A5B0DYN5_9HYPH|nr:MBL fold metallo-hydrolase [Aureimonas fodinaquatilis]KAA0971937.1 MBL fold metallo-hydrolase [Aureimonas fodinaquatilis]